VPNTAYLEDNRQDEEDETLNGLVGGVVSTVGRREGSDAEGEGAGRGTVTDCVEDHETHEIYLASRDYRDSFHEPSTRVK
jgi:hypothetical protein